MSDNTTPHRDNQQFIDAIEEALVSVHGPSSRLAVDMNALAAAVLDTPEMHAIKEVLSCAQVACGYAEDPIKQQAKLEWLLEALQRLPESASNWALS